MANHEEKDDGIQVKLPDTFSGGARELERFLSQCQVYFALKQSKFPNQSTKIFWASGLLRGSAADWFTPKVNDYARGPTGMSSATKEFFAHYNNFVNELRQLYSTRDLQRSSIRQLENLKQTTTASSYVAIFQRLAPETKLDQVALARQFYKGLKRNIQLEVTRMPNPPKSLDEMIEVVISLDERFYEFYKDNGVGTQRQPYDNRRTTPMDLSATRGPLSPRDREHRMKNNLCLYCGKAGHRARECKAKKQGTLAATQVHEYESEETPQYLRATRQGPTNKGKQPIDVPDWINDIELPSDSQVEQEVNLPRAPTPDAPQDLEHEKMHWAFCTNDNCLVHYQGKLNGGYEPKKSNTASNDSVDHDDCHPYQVPPCENCAWKWEETSTEELPSDQQEKDLGWNPESTYVRNDECMVAVPGGNMVTMALKERQQQRTVLVLMVRRMRAEEIESLVDNIGTIWIDSENPIYTQRLGKGIAAGQRSTERRQKDSLLEKITLECDLPPRLEECTYTPPSSSTGNKS